MIRTLALSLSLALLAVVPASAAKKPIKPRTYVSPKLSPQERPLQKVLLLPAHVEITVMGLKGRESMTRESEQVAGQLAAVLTKQLAGCGVTALPDAFTEEALKKDGELQSTLVRLQRRYDNIGTQLHAKPGEVRKTRYTLGDEVATLRPAAEADALVFVRGAGTLLTRGKSALGMLSPNPTFQTLKTTLAFVHARSGDVLAFVEMEPMGDFVGNTDKVVAKTLAKRLKAIPFIPKTKSRARKQ